MSSAPAASRSVSSAPGTPWRGLGQRLWGAGRSAGVPRLQPGLPGPAWMRVVSRRYHFSVGTLAYAATTCVLVVGAINGQNNLLFWLFGLAVGGLMVSGVLSGMSLMGLRISREVDPGAQVGGDDLVLRYHVSNRNRFFPLCAVLIEEMPVAYSWLGKRLDAQFSDHVPTPRVHVPIVRARQSLMVEVRVPARRRGSASFHALRASSSFPFGIVRKSVTLAAHASTILRPRQTPVDPARWILGGLSRSVASVRPSRDGDEFFSLRDYVPGDALRSVAWRATARLDRPVTRQHALVQGRTLRIVLDDRPATQDADVFEQIVSLGAGVAHALSRHGVGASLWMLSHDAPLASLPPGPRGQGPHAAPNARLGDLLDQLALIQPATERRGRGLDAPGAESTILVSSRALPALAASTARTQAAWIEDVESTQGSQAPSAAEGAP